MIEEKAEDDAVDDYQDKAEYLTGDKGPTAIKVSYLYPMKSCHDIYSFIQLRLRTFFC